MYLKSKNFKEKIVLPNAICSSSDCSFSCVGSCDDSCSGYCFGSCLNVCETSGVFVFAD